MALLFGWMGVLFAEFLLFVVLLEAVLMVLCCWSR